MAKANRGGRRGDASTGGGNGGRYHDVTDKYRGMSLHQFEDAIRDKKTEFAGVFDADGNLIAAYTSYRSGSVSFPGSVVSGAAVFTHNHPSWSADEPDRTVGGTFSEKDVLNHIDFGFGETRAVSSARHEHTYILRTKQGADRVKLREIAMKSKRNGTMVNRAKIEAQKVESSMRQNGYSESQIRRQRKRIMYGLMQRYWRNGAKFSGFEYVEVKERHW